MLNGDESAAELHGSAQRRILKVRLPQEQVIRLHELRILQSTSIAALLEAIIDDYFRRHGLAEGQRPAPHEGKPEQPNHQAGGPLFEA